MLKHCFFITIISLAQIVILCITKLPVLLIKYHINGIGSALLSRFWFFNISSTDKSPTAAICPFTTVSSVLDCCEPDAVVCVKMSPADVPAYLFHILFLGDMFDTLLTVCIS
ncbi:unnamed protein product [Clavelina lepadiformis]|uniref:Uncharacterized protein n=1 Tax=Clavelina lepadiformis TaxID=159417 RepID=A0ABP0F7M3_CLALP